MGVKCNNISKCLQQIRKGSIHLCRGGCTTHAKPMHDGKHCYETNMLDASGLYRPDKLKTPSEWDGITAELKP